MLRGQLYNRQALRFKKLESQGEIDRAREMLVRLAEPGWPPPHDAGGLCVGMSRYGKPMLMDKVDPFSAFFALEYDAAIAPPSGSLAAVWRITIVTEQICPIAAYRPYTPELPEFLMQSSAEGTRLILDPRLRRTGASLLLFGGVFEWLQRVAKITWLYTSAQVPKPAETFEELGLKRAAVPEFVFGPGDPRPSRLLYIDVTSALHMVGQLLGEGKAAA
jgi:hypothetical protein